MAIREELDVAAHNIANMNTPSYKGERMVFREYISAPNYRERHSFVDRVGLSRDTTLGSFKTTNNVLDFALSNENNFFVIDTPMGERFTRHGHFELNEEGELVTTDGYRVMGNGNSIQIPETAGENIMVTADGAIHIGNAVNEAFDQLRVVEINDSTLLKRAAGSLYILNADNVAPLAGQPSVLQGILENSNVKAITELTRITEISRMYEAINGFLDKEDKRVTRMLEGLGKPFN